MPTERTILAVPGLGRTSPGFRAALWDVAERNGWDVDALAIVISIESGFDPAAKNPSTTASGLIQMLDSTAKGLGIEGGAPAVRAMSAEAQLPFVEKYFKRAFGILVPRREDFYLAGYGKGVGQGADYVLASQSDPLTFAGNTKNAYMLNQGLDVDGDGEITVGDIRKVVNARAAQAQGKRLSAEAPSSDLATLAVVIAAGFAYWQRKEIGRWFK